MRILFLTNYYLPFGTGGEERSCQQVVEGLKARGHQTLVLTSMHGTRNVPEESQGIHRALYLEMDLAPWRHSLTFFTQRKAREAQNLRRLTHTVRTFRPDAVFVWGMWNLPKSLPALAEQLCPQRVVYRFATYWPTLPSQHENYWRAPGRTRLSRLIKTVLGPIALAMLAREKPPPALAFAHSMCVSAAAKRQLLEAGVPVANARVIHTGIDMAPYLSAPAQPRAHEDGPVLRLLYAGRLVAEKGVETAVQALALLESQQRAAVQLSIAGAGDNEYEAHLQGLVQQAGLTDTVTFLGHVPGEEMPALLRQFDVLLLPSIWPEPFSRMVLEGMSAGLVVLAAATGGTPEIVRNGENGLLFEPGQAAELAERIARLTRDPELRQRLAQAGQQTVREGFTFDRMLSEIEALLQAAAQSTPVPAG